MNFADSTFKVLHNVLCFRFSVQKYLPCKKVRTSGVGVSEMKRRCNEYYRRAAGYTMLLVLPSLQRIYANDQFPTANVVNALQI